MNLPVVAPIASLSRRLALWWTMALLTAAAGLVVMWGWVGQRALHSEHEAAALRMATLFEASLRNAMLARDLPGLQRLIDTLGGMPGLKAAALLSPAGQVRFASAPSRVGHDEPAVLAGQCVAASCAEVSPPSLQWTHDQAGQALRVTYPVRNEVRCGACHGPVSQQPVNGVLVLDFSPMAGELLARQRTSTWLLPASLGVLALLGLAAAWVLRREVLRPVAALSAQVDRLASGDLQARSGVPAESGDELRHLAHGFDRMASQVQSHVQALRGQSEFVQAMIDAAPDPMLVIDEQHRIVMANVAYSQLLGHAPQAIIGQPCYRISRGNAEPCPSTLVRCPVAMCRAHEPAERTVMAFTRADGSQTDVEIDAASLTGPDGQRLVIEVIRPLGEQLRFSQEQRLSAIGLLANGVAHEIHNPLASIRLALQASLRGLRDGSMERDELMAYLRLVDEQIDRCVLITQRLLRLSQPSADTAQPVPVRPAVEDTLALLAEEARQADITSQVQLEPDDARVLMDESELRQVLLNLAQNAIRAMPQGGQLTIVGQRRQGRFILQVSDTGVGISPEALPLIFLPFYSRRADGHRGTGLGLAICKALVQQRGGRLSASSEPGVGSRFEVELIDADATPAPAPSGAPAPVLARGAA
jgi:PAS domain S-box-containing protein